MSKLVAEVGGSHNNLHGLKILSLNFSTHYHRLTIEPRERWWSAVAARWRELQKPILYADDGIKYARKKFHPWRESERAARGEFNLISHNRTYNLDSEGVEQKVSLERSWDLIWKYFNTHTWHKMMFIYVSPSSRTRWELNKKFFPSERRAECKIASTPSVRTERFITFGWDFSSICWLYSHRHAVNWTVIESMNNQYLKMSDNKRLLGEEKCGFT